MNKQAFLTRRPEPLPEWLIAFPGAMVCDFADQDSIPKLSAGTTIWLHADGHSKSPESVVLLLRQHLPLCPVIVLSNVPNDNEGLAVLEAGASGYTGVLAVADVLRQIQTVVQNGGIWVGPNLMHRLLLAMGASSAISNTKINLGRLTPREREVALAVAAGQTNKEVARQLNISERTVKAHLSQVFDILKVRDRLQLAIHINGLPATGLPSIL